MTAPGLLELQREFLEALLAAPGSAGGEPAHGALSAPVRGALRPLERFEVYAGMYFWRLRDVLAEDYPRLVAALGGDDFTVLVRAYLTAHPSRHPSVRHVGRHLAGHLGGGWAADLAALEWARVDAFDAADAAPIGAADLGGIPPEAWGEVRFATVPSLTIVRAGWPVHRIWDEPAARPDPEPTVLRVWRHDGRVWHAAMAPDEARALEALCAGAPFGAVCEPFDDATAAATLLARWLDDGLIAGVTLPG